MFTDLWFVKKGLRLIVVEVCEGYPADPSPYMNGRGGQKNLLNIWWLSSGLKSGEERNPGTFFHSTHTYTLGNSLLLASVAP
jgi:hypothetical protein